MWISRAFFHLCCIRSIELLPACEESLSTIHETVAPRRRARRSLPVPPTGRTARSRSWLRRGRTGWRGGDPRRRVPQDAALSVVELEPSRRRRPGSRVAPQRLQLSVLVGADHVLVGTQAAGPGSDGGRGRAPGPPSQRRRPRTQIQKRCCHGFRASSCSQRRLVAADSSLRPRWTTSSSLCEKRGYPSVAGSSQANGPHRGDLLRGKRRGQPKLVAAKTALQLGADLAAHLDHIAAPTSHTHRFNTTPRTRPHDQGPNLTTPVTGAGHGAGSEFRDAAGC